MDFALQPHLYKNVPVIFWPWLFLQLWRIALWGEAAGRDIMVAVDTKGRVHIRHIGDDPDLWAPSPHPHRHQYNLTPRLAGESQEQCRARIAAAYAPGFGVQQWIISPKVLGETALRLVIPDFVPTNIRDPVISQIPRLSRDTRGA